MIKLIKCSLLLAILWYVLAVLVSHNIYFQYSRSLFLVDGNFFVESLGKICGFANYCTALLAQFMEREWMGALIFSLVLTGVYALTDSVIKIFRKEDDYLNLAMLPVALQVILFVSSQYSFVPLFCFALTMLMVYVWSRLKGYVALGFAVAMTALLYPLIGMWFLVFVLAVILANRSKLNLTLIAIAAATPAIYALLYLNTMGDLYTAQCDFQLIATLVYITLIAVALKHLPTIKKSMIVSSASALVIVTVSSYMFITRYDYREKVMLEIERAMSNQDWEHTLELGSSYPNTNILTTFAINTALLNLNQLPQRAFNYAQPFGVEGLFIGRHGSNRKSEYAHYMYASLGLYNEAHRQLWESMTTTGRNLSNIKGLILYNRMMGRENIAQKFNGILGNTIFEKEYYQSIDLNKYHPLFTTQAQGARFNNPQNIMADLSYMVAKAQNLPSRQVVDCFLVSLLLSNRVVEFGKHSKLIKAHYNSATLPPVYAQALMLLKTRLTAEEFAVLGIELPAQYENQYYRYAQTHKASRGNGEQMEEFAGTYYYYLNFLSPNGPKIITK